MDREDSEGSYRYSCTPSLTSALDEGSQCHILTAFFCAKIWYALYWGPGGS